MLTLNRGGASHDHPKTVKSQTKGVVRVERVPHTATPNRGVAHALPHPKAKVAPLIARGIPIRLPSNEWVACNLAQSRPTEGCLHPYRGGCLAQPFVHLHLFFLVYVFSRSFFNNKLIFLTRVMCRCKTAYLVNRVFFFFYSKR